MTSFFLHRLSSPLNSLLILSLCFKHMRTAISREVIAIISDLPETIRIIGIMVAESMDPRETKSDIQTVKIKKIRAIRQQAGEMARKIPNVVATPFPPRNPWKRENWWPRRANNPTMDSPISKSG